MKNNEILKVDLQSRHLGKTKAELSALLDDEVELFSQYMANLGDWKSAGPLSGPERALIKTYLIQKIKATGITLDK